MEMLPQNPLHNYHKLTKCLLKKIQRTGPVWELIPVEGGRA
jgi:hypothetical protein